MNDDEDPVSRKRRLAKERQQRYRARQTPQSKAKIRVLDAEAHQQRTTQMSVEELQIFHAFHAASQQRYVYRLTPQHLEAFHTSIAASQRHRIEQMSPHELQLHRETNAASQRHRVEQMSPNELQLHRETNAASQRHRVEQMSPNELQLHRAANAISQRLARDRAGEAVRNEAINFNETQFDQHDCGEFDVLCTSCRSRNFAAEQPSDGLFTSCCRKGKVMLPKPIDIHGNTLEYPDFLKSLMSDTANPDRQNFRQHIRSYNSAVCFASMAAKIFDLLMYRIFLWLSNVILFLLTIFIITGAVF